MSHLKIHPVPLIVQILHSMFKNPSPNDTHTQICDIEPLFYQAFAPYLQIKAVCVNITVNLAEEGAGKMASKIKLIASDLDGTLLTSDKKIPPALADGISGLIKRGVIFVPATGRPLGSIPKDVFDIKGIKYVISSNGAAVKNIQTGIEIIRTCLNADIGLSIIENTRNKEIMAELFSEGIAYTEKRFIECVDKYAVSAAHMEYVLSTRKPIDDSADFIRRNSCRIENINLIFKDKNLRAEFKNHLSARKDISVTSSSPNNIEITSSSATKGRALKLLCEKLSVKPCEVMAFGDNGNDEDMLGFAGVGVATANGEEHIKKLTDYVTLSCDEGGVLHAVNKFMDMFI